MSQGVFWWKGFPEGTTMRGPVRRMSPIHSGVIRKFRRVAGVSKERGGVWSEVRRQIM